MGSLREAVLIPSIYIHVMYCFGYDFSRVTCNVYILLSLFHFYSYHLLSWVGGSHINTFIAFPPIPSHPIPSHLRTPLPLRILLLHPLLILPIPLLLLLLRHILDPAPRIPPAQQPSRIVVRELLLAARLPRFLRAAVHLRALGVGVLCFALRARFAVGGGGGEGVRGGLEGGLGVGHFWYSVWCGWVLY